LKERISIDPSKV
jgi:hypothetical protein